MLPEIDKKPFSVFDTASLRNVYLSGNYLY